MNCHTLRQIPMTPRKKSATISLRTLQTVTTFSLLGDQRSTAIQKCDVLCSFKKRFFFYCKKMYCMSESHNCVIDINRCCLSRCVRLCGSWRKGSVCPSWKTSHQVCSIHCIYLSQYTCKETRSVMVLNTTEA